MPHSRTVPDEELAPFMRKLRDQAAAGDLQNVTLTSWDKNNQLRNLWFTPEAWLVFANRFLEEHDGEWGHDSCGNQGGA